MRAWLPILLPILLPLLSNTVWLHLKKPDHNPLLGCLSSSMHTTGASAVPRQIPAELDFSQMGMRMLMAEEGRFVKGGRHVLHGGQVAHIGYGHRLYGNEGLELQRGIEERDAETLLWKDVERAAGSVRGLVQIPLRQHEFDALVMLAFNIGAQGFRDSPVLQLLNAGKRREAGESFCTHSRLRSGDSDGNQESPAIRRRRADERYLFLTGRYIQAQPRNEADTHHGKQ